MVVGSSTRRWDVRRRAKHARLEGTRKALGLSGKVIPTNKIGMAIDTLVMPGDRVVLEGNNQKQADFLSRALVNVDSERIHDLHMIMPSVSLPEHMDLFEKGIAKRLDFSYAGSQSLRIAQLLEDGQLEIGAIHTYVELYSRLYVDLIPNVVLVAAYAADREGNLYTGPSTEDTPALLEAAAFHDGVVIAQVNEIVDDPKDLKRVDIPGSWVDYVVKADRPFFIEPLFTRDPRQIKDAHILMAMMALKGIYAPHEVESLNHGIGFNTAAVELLLPTFGEELGIKGKVCRHWCLNPHPTLIPAIESGWVKSVTALAVNWGWKTTLLRARTCSLRGRTVPCVRTALSAKWQGNTPLTCSWAQLSRWIRLAIHQPLRAAAWLASAELPTWGTTRMAVGTQRKPGLK